MNAQSELSEKIMAMIEKSLGNLHSENVNTKILIRRYIGNMNKRYHDESDVDESWVSEILEGYIKTCQVSFYRIFEDYDISIEGFLESPDHCFDTSYTGGLFKLHERLLQEDIKILEKIKHRVESVIECFNLL